MMKGTVLLIDDNKDVTTLLSDILSAEGYKVICSFDGQDGFEKMKTYMPDLVLLDVYMPLKNGIEVCKAAKHSELTKLIPIIILSSAGQMEEIEQALKEGAVAYISKPSTCENIIKMVKDHISPQETPAWLCAKKKTASCLPAK